MKELILTIGVMGSGKSTLVLSENYEANRYGKTALLLKPITDTKAGSEVSSRLKISQEVDFLISSEKGDFTCKLEKYFSKYNNEIKKIIIDEIQFLTQDNVWELIEFAVDRDIVISCYSLQSDFKAEAFLGTFYILPFVTEFRGSPSNPISRISGEVATMNVRKINDEITFKGDKIAIDEEGLANAVTTYESVSVNDFIKLKRKWEAEHGG